MHQGFLLNTILQLLLINNSFIKSEGSFLASYALTLFKMGFFGVALGWVGEGGVKKAPFPKICLTYPTVTVIKVSTIIPYLKKIKKNIKIT